MKKNALINLGLASIIILGSQVSQADTDDHKPENFISWRTGLSSSAQPQIAYLRQLKAHSYDMVINLAPPQSMGSLENEGGLVGKQGLVYVNIPVDFEAPRLQDFETFSEMMKAGKDKNILVHCQADFRGSSFVFLYEVIHEGVPAQEAAAKLNSIWAPNSVWKKFIQQTLVHYGKPEDLF